MMISGYFGMNVLDLPLSDKPLVFETIFRDPGDYPGGDGPFNGEEENILKNPGAFFSFFLLRPL
jgi:hypothetical protein